MKKWINAVLLFLFVGGLVCTPPPLPQIKIIPLPDKDNIVLGPENKSVSLSEQGLSINVSNLSPEDLNQYSVVLKPIRPEDFNVLFKNGYVNYAQGDNAELLLKYRLTQSYPRELRYSAFGTELANDGWEINPYLEKKNALLIFKVIIENKTAQKIEIEPAQSVVLDDQKKQYAPYTREDWQGFFPLVWAPQFVMITYGSALQLTHYFVPREVAIKNEIIDQTLLEVKKVYPGVTMEGLVVFPMVSKDVQEFRLILPEIKFYDQNNEVVKKKDFSYKFKIVTQSAP